ncbi:hypothetical protein WDU94_014551 [Cyamophila willieti]
MGHLILVVASVSIAWTRVHCSLLDITVTVPTFSSEGDENNTTSFDFSKYDIKDQSKEELTHQNLMNHLESEGILRTRRVQLALTRFPRDKYMSHEKHPVITLLDIPHNIGYNAFMESPSDHCTILELLSAHLNLGERVLEIGTGSGYLTIMMAAMVGSSGKVFTIEHIPELLESARKHIKAKAENYIKRINFYVGQGKNGLPKEAPYSAIYVGGSVDNIPIELIKQLKPGGRLLVPIKSDPNDDPILTIIDRYLNNTVVTTEVQRVFIDPLRELYEQKSLNRTWEDDLMDDFYRNTHPPMSPEDERNYTGWYHTNKMFMSLYDLVNARPNLFTVEFDPNKFKILGTKPKPTYVTDEPIRGLKSQAWN